MNEATSADPLDTTSTPSKTKKVKKVGTDKKPSKAVVTKPNGKAAPAKAAKKAAPPAKAAKPAPKKAPAGDAPKMQQPEDGVVLKAVAKLKEATMASKFAADLGVHRRVIRAQLQRLAKDKANGVSMKKDGPHWLVASTVKK